MLQVFPPQHLQHFPTVISPGNGRRGIILTHWIRVPWRWGGNRGTRGAKGASVVTHDAFVPAAFSAAMKNILTVSAEPYPYEFIPEQTALLIIDMQR